MMRVVSPFTCILGTLALAVFASGCAKQTPSGPVAVEVAGSPPAGDHDGHDHGDEHQGPHDGHVIELGRNHEYHAELVENEEAGKVTVYMLDKDLKELAIDQATIVMNLKVDGEGKTYELVAVGASNGKASQFEATDRLLFEALHEHKATGKLRVTINGAPYSGDVEHHHHGAHDDDHDHGHGDKHDH